MINVKYINKSALLGNLKYCQSFNKRIMVMVKANAYGHGLKEIIFALKDKVFDFGVANGKEAIKLKKLLEHKHRILVVGKSLTYRELIKNKTEFTIDSVKELHRVLKDCKSCRKQAKIHIAINTGMNRIGVKNLSDFREILNYIEAHKKYLCLIGVFTHCYDADGLKTNFYKQMKKFEKFYYIVKDKKILIHIGGSYCLNHKLPSFVNMIRTGFFLYGYGKLNLKPVMRIESKIIKLTPCKKGEYVGYGKTKLKKDKTIATVPLGYADGVLRQVSNKAYVKINGLKCKIIGKVCMDMFMVDVTGVNAKIGDRVVVFDNAEYFANLAKTSPYEILTNFSKARANIKVIKNDT